MLTLDSIGFVRDEVICSCDLNFLLHQELFAMVPWTVGMPRMKLFVLLDSIFCSIWNWFATVPFTVGMLGMKLFVSLLYQELVCDGRVDSRNVWDQVICSCELNFLLYQELVCDGRLDCRNVRNSYLFLRS